MNAREAVAQYDLGRELAARGKLGDAAALFEQAIRLKADFIEAYNALAVAFMQQGHAEAALGVLRRAMAIGGAAETKALLVQALRGMPGIPDLDDLRQLMVRALTEPWTRASEVVPIAASLIRNDKSVRGVIARVSSTWPHRPPVPELLDPAILAALAENDLLLALLQSTPISDLTLERFLTALRAAMLELAAARNDDEGVVRLCCALARQCFINEYVYPHAEGEWERARDLRDQVARTPAPALAEIALAATACYSPLHCLPEAAGLLDHTWSEDIAGVLTQQVRECEVEQQLRAALPALTAIADSTSREVRAQYEERAYPRWVRAEPPMRPQTIDRFLTVQFPAAPYRALGESVADILIAGCGTGLQAIETCCRFPQAHVLAVDLSRASLAYAKRKAWEAGLDRITFAQADILELGKVEQAFDMIVACGVLHHMREPFVGWRVLLSRLRPHGVMAVSLLSELARSHVRAARALVAERGFGPTAADIRRCRQELLALPDGALARKVTQAEEFFTVSECRDLLFHVQEAHHTLPEIAAFLASEKLELLGFELPGAVRARYRAQFPDDPAMTNLDHWHRFETENPDTFTGMYYFWIQQR